MNTKASKCPYCNNDDMHKDMEILFQHKDQGIARSVLNRNSGFTPTKDNKADLSKLDPISSLTFKYEHAKGMEGRMEVLSNGLSIIHGTFTSKDVEQIIGKDPAKIIEGMLKAGHIYESSPGKYRLS